MQNSVVQWLEYTAKRFPDRTAFSDENKSYTWREVRRMALSVAVHLDRFLPDRRSPVAVYMEKSADMLVAYMGIAYSGNFYSPIDVDMPSSRAEKIIQTLQPKMLIATKTLKDDVGKKSSGGGISYILKTL